MFSLCRSVVHGELLRYVLVDALSVRVLQNRFKLENCHNDSALVFLDCLLGKEVV